VRAAIASLDAVSRSPTRGADRRGPLPRRGHAIRACAGPAHGAFRTADAHRPWAAM